MDNAFNGAARTPEQIMVLGQRAMYGAAYFVARRKSGWVVTVGGVTVNCVFKTKRAALAQADGAVEGFARRGLYL